MKFKKLTVIAPEGRHITGYGSRLQGEVFELPDQVANALLKDQPGAFEELLEETEEIQPDAEGED